MSTGRMMRDLTTPILGGVSLLGYAGVQVFKKHNRSLNTELLDDYTASAVCILTICVNFMAFVQNIDYIKTLRTNNQLSDLGKTQKVILVFASILAVGTTVYASINLASSVMDQAAINRTVFANFISPLVSYFSRPDVSKSQNPGQEPFEPRLTK